MNSSSLWIALVASALTWTGCLSPSQARPSEAPRSSAAPLEAPAREDPAVVAAPNLEPTPRRTWLRYESSGVLDPSWITRPPSANRYPRWEQLLDQRRLSDGAGLRLGESSSLGALWTSEDGPAGVVAFRREF